MTRRMRVKAPQLRGRFSAYLLYWTCFTGTKVGGCGWWRGEVLDLLALIALLALLAVLVPNLGENDAEDAGEGAAAEGEVLSLLALLDLLYWYKSTSTDATLPVQKYKYWRCARLREQLRVWGAREEEEEEEEEEDMWKADGGGKLIGEVRV
jgi:hypothetical protein